MTTAIARTMNWLDANLETLQAEAPEGYDISRAKRTLAHLLKQSEKSGAKLHECSPSSLVQACMYLVHLGLDADMKEAHVIARRNGRGYEADVMIDYRGLLIMAKRSGEVMGVSVDVVRKGDSIDYKRGTALADSYLKHEPIPFNDGDIVGSFAIFRLRNGLVEFEAMSKAQIDNVRKKAAGGSGAWRDFYEEMAKKVVLRRGLKRLELRPDDKRALIQDDRTWFAYEDAMARTRASVSTEALNDTFSSPKGLPALPHETPEPTPPKKRRSRKDLMERLDGLLSESGHGEKLGDVHAAIAMAGSFESMADMDLDDIENLIADLAGASAQPGADGEMPPREEIVQGFYDAARAVRDNQ